MFEEDTLVEKLRKLEALYAGTRVAGEREAASRAAERIRARLAELRSEEKEVELLYRLPDPWSRKLFIALCRRYGLKPYREAGRRYSTVIVRAPRTFHDRTLWPEFKTLSAELEKHWNELAEKVIREAIHTDVSETMEKAPPKTPPQDARIAALAPAEADEAASPGTSGNSPT